MTDRYNITVVGLGYVGMSLAVLLARQHRVTALDIDERRVACVNSGRPTVADALMNEYMANEQMSLTATTSPAEAYADAYFVIVATPTNYDPDKNYFDTSSVEAVIEQARNYNSGATIVIKSTLPVGFTEQLKQTLNDDKLMFSPEFLREDQALHDNLHPSRIVVGGAADQAALFGQLLQQ
ncbi:MAG: 3-hydroxyacyl-CoA dehydrogenase NAD-binding domain-containing protein, partial [Luminiphilus sp.]|nr:3-hydroxyacyl-CoA dehydrogenase NAD-binding domain-containing protein [Luminiphilus sp.]